VTNRIEGYAAAVFDVASAEGVLDRVEREFFALGKAVESQPELREALTDPRIPADRKQSILDDLLGGRASDVTVALVEFIVRAGRGRDLPAIADALAARAAASRDREVAEVRTAVPLDDETVARLSEALGRATGKQVEVRVVVDPSVVGGVVARVGDTVIDGSVRRRLESLREILQSR